jgi:hypothetical protein
MKLVLHYRKSCADGVLIYNQPTNPLFHARTKHIKI